MTKKQFITPMQRVNLDEPQEIMEGQPVQKDYKVVDEDGGFSPRDSTASLKEIILQHIRAITKLSCQELTPSYWQKKPIKVGDGVVMAETYHEDKRLALCNAIEFLVYILWAEADKDFKDFFERQLVEENRLFIKFQESGKTQDAWVWKKLDYSKRVFWNIMLMIKRTGLFEGEVYQESQ
jgi:hypothetical protein